MQKLVPKKTRSPKHHTSWGDMDQELNREKRVKFAVKKSSAKREGNEWTISYDDVQWPTTCPVLGVELVYFSEGRTDSSVSMCRRDSVKPWTPDNLLVCSYRASRLLRFSLEELEKVTRYLS